MKMKQKMAMVHVVFGLLLGFGGLFYSPNTLAQNNIPTGCPGSVDQGPPSGECPDGADSSSDAACDSESTNCCGDVETSIIGDDLCKDVGEEGGIIFGLLKGVLTILTAGIGIAAVGGIAYGALLYTTAESKPEQTKKAIGIITNVVIGIVAYALMYVFLNFLIPGGILT